MFFSALFSRIGAFTSPCSFSSPCWLLQISSCLTHVYQKHVVSSGWVLRRSHFPDVLLRCFFLHSSFAMYSAILLAMAFDRYVAICFPLRYTSIPTYQIIMKIMMGIICRSFCIIFPCVFLLKWLPFCRTLIIPHTYCEHIGIARLACADISINIWYGFAVPILTVTSDLILTGISYVLVLRAVFNLPSWAARQKALSTCGCHVCVILIFYTPAIFSVLTLCFGHNIPHSFHILYANLYVSIPPAINPVIYGVKTKQIRDKVKLLFFSRGDDKRLMD